MIESMGAITTECVRQTEQLDCAMHNIANVDTTGFKAAMMFFMKDGATRSGEGKPIFINDFSQGILKRTGNKLDMAIQGEGFFAVETEDGFGYTRDGRFLLNNDGELVTQGGRFVMGKSGKITIAGSDVQINEKGVIMVDGVEVDTIKVSIFEQSNKLVRGEGGLFFDPDETAGTREADDAAVISGSLELSNVHPIQEMVKLIDIHRTFESYQKTMQTLQEQDKLSTTSIGKV